MSLAKQVSAFGSDQNVQPPDTQIAAGPSGVLEATNDTLSAWSKSGTPLAAPVDLNVFLGVPSAQSFSDPRILYDTSSGRWFLSGFSFNATLADTTTFLAVSASSNPTGNWIVYTVNSSTTGEVTDQPMIGVCNDKVTMSWNDFSGGGATYNSSVLEVIQKSSVVAGANTVNVEFFSDPNQFRLVPAQSLASSSTCWGTINDADTALLGSSTSPTIGVISITGTPNKNNVAVKESNPSIVATIPPPAPAQPSGTTNDTQNDDRFLSAVWQNNELWTTATDACTPTGDTTTRNCMRLIEVNTSGTPSVVHDEDLSTSGLDQYYPAVSLAYSGDLFVSYTASSSTVFPGANAVISPAAALGQSSLPFTPPITIEAGAASYNGGTSARWGDYSAAAPDPSLPGAVWVAAEYAPSDAASGDWATGAAEVTLATSPAFAVGAQGTDGQLMANIGGVWTPLGGKIAGPPAVVAAPNADGTTAASPLFIATGTNKELFIRSTTANWQVIGTAKCIGSPAAVVTGTSTLTVTVACRGTNNALWDSSATWSGTGLPTFGSFKSLGGVLSAGPAVAPVGGTLTFFVRGTNGHIYTRTLTASYAATPWVCTGQPAAAQGSSSDTFFACAAGGHLFEAVNGGSGWSPAVSLGGSILGGPAAAPTSEVPELFAEGTNHAIWERTPSGWSTIGGSVVGGVGAAALN
jgi:hypothetical protein